jgi:hypothetical protein
LTKEKNYKYCGIKVYVDFEYKKKLRIGIFILLEFLIKVNEINSKQYK